MKEHSIMPQEHPLVDLEFATSQLSGNTDLLFKMLKKFKTEFSAVPMQVTNLIATGDLKGAKLKVHTTKGLSGNLGLMALFNCSKELDQELRAGNVVTQLVEEFTIIMQQTCDHIDSVNTDTKANPTYSNTENKVKSDYKDVFIQRLQRNEFIDDDTLHSYIESLNLTSDSKKTLQSMVEELNYDSAVELIKQHA